MFEKKIRIITHNGHFHADDVFAVALLELLNENKGVSYEIIRTRDQKLLNTGDFVLDVGGVYNPDTNHFDHHQKGGAGVRENGVPYSSFGLVWKKFGIEFSLSEDVALQIEKKMVEYIDARDNGIDVTIFNNMQIFIYDSGNVIEAFSPGFEEDRGFDEAFTEAVDVAKKILIREKIKTYGAVKAKKVIILIYKNTKDKRIIVFDKYYPSNHILTNYPEPLYVVYPDKENNTWHTRAVAKNINSFENRKNFPKIWGGKINEELAKITGVKDAIFCHNNLFLAVAQSKESAIALAKKALEA